MTQDQASILLQLIQNDSNLNSSSLGKGWRIDIPVCEWKGIECEQDDIVGIDLQGFQIESTLPESFSQLSSLKFISLASNYLHGTIPDKITKLPLLVEVNLSNNQLTGTVPIFLSNAIQTVNLGHNRLSGNLPEYINTSKKKLQKFNIENNKIVGTIPSSIINMGVESLVELNLGNNHLSGTLPHSLSQFTNLESLYLNENQLTGNIPQMLFQHMKELSAVFLFENNFSGKIPVTISDLPSLGVLFISGNKLTGEIPNAVCQMNLNDKFYESRHRRTSIDEHVWKIENVRANHSSNTRSLAGMPDERNGCNSIACPVGKYSSKIKDGAYPCIPCDEGTIAPYIGSSKCLFLNERNILNEFLLSTDSMSWLSESVWTDEMSPCSRNGVTCNRSNKVRSIRLPYMNITGTISPMLGYLQHLEELDLSGNNFFGKIPSDLQFAPLVYLDLTDNKLTGNIPRSLCLKDGLNGNGNRSVWSCDKIACAPGSFSSSGRGEEDACRPCLHNQTQYIGSKSCQSKLVPKNTTPGNIPMKTGILVVLLLMPIFIIACFYYFILKEEKEDSTTHRYEKKELYEVEFDEYVSKSRSNVLKETPVQAATGGTSSVLWLDVPKFT